MAWLEVLVLAVSFVALLIIGVPVAFAIGIATVLTLLTGMPVDPALTTVAQRMATGLDTSSDRLQAVAVFRLRGEDVSYDGPRDALAAGIAIIPDCGQVPGMGTSLTVYAMSLLDETDDVRLAIASYYQGLTATRRHGIYSSSEFYVDGIIALRDRFD